MFENLKNKKIALVHDYLLAVGGAERVLRVLHEMFPEAPIYTVVYDRNFTKSFLGDAKVYGSFLQKSPPFLRKKYKYLSFLIPSAVENFDLSEYDLVISSCSAFVKGVITRPNTLHLCYCHTPTRFLWDFTHNYAKSTSRKGLTSYFINVLFHMLRLWDQQAAKRVDFFIANSKHVASRIKKYYKKDSKVIYPPVSLSRETSDSASPKLPLLFKDYYLIVSRLWPYKQIDIAIEAFKKLKFPLIVIGQGSEKKNLEAISKGFENIKILGYQCDENLSFYYQNARAFIFPGEEDFGIAMVEAMLYGKPVLALRKGGALEIVVEGVTGEFFDDPHPVLLADGVRRINEGYGKYNPEIIKERTRIFSRQRFEKELLEFINECYDRHNNGF